MLKCNNKNYQNLKGSQGEFSPKSHALTSAFSLILSFERWIRLKFERWDFVCFGSFLGDSIVLPSFSTIDFCCIHSPLESLLSFVIFYCNPPWVDKFEFVFLLYVRHVRGLFKKVSSGMLLELIQTWLKLINFGFASQTFTDLFLEGEFLSRIKSDLFDFVFKELGLRWYSGLRVEWWCCFYLGVRVFGKCMYWLI